MWVLCQVYRFYQGKSKRQYKEYEEDDEK